MWATSLAFGVCTLIAAQAQEIIDDCPQFRRALDLEDGWRLFVCVPSDPECEGALFGCGTYTDNSNLCRAAAHQGFAPGTVFEARLTDDPELEGYEPCTKNGITSSGRDKPWNHDDAQIRAPQRCDAATACGLLGANCESVTCDVYLSSNAGPNLLDDTVEDIDTGGDISITSDDDDVDVDPMYVALGAVCAMTCGHDGRTTTEVTCVDGGFVLTGDVCQEHDEEEAVPCSQHGEEASCGDDPEMRSKPKFPLNAQAVMSQNLGGLNNEGNEQGRVLLEVSPDLQNNNIELLADELRGLCRTTNNLAFRADTVPSGSGGGVTSYGPSNMNDGNQCQFYWPWGNSATIQYRWKRAVNMEHFVLRTNAACESGSFGCAFTGDGRGVGSGTVQWWNGATWVTDGSFTNLGSTLEYKFRSCISTVSVRIVNIVTHDCGQQSNPVIYEWSICECEEKLRLCGDATNLAPFAKASGSSGGLDFFGYGPSELNDGEECQWYWPTATAQPTSPFIRYEWKTPVFVKRFALLTDAACTVNTACSPFANLGRGVGAATVAYRTAAGVWVVDGSLSSSTRLIEYELRECVEITVLEVRNIVTHNCGQVANPVIYEWSACCCEPDACCHEHRTKPVAIAANLAAAARTQVP